MTAGWYLLRLIVCLAVLSLFVLISPGIGTESASVGWWDAWRARLGIAIDPEELAGHPFADGDQDGKISAEEATAFAAHARHIGFALRLPRTLLALQVGMTLALCGAVLQVLFRNQLAEPYTLGIASGGSLGALLAIRLGWTVTLLGLSAVVWSAFVGAVAVVAAAFALARGARRLTSNELLLAGVTIGVFCGAMMMFVTALSDERVTFEVIRWMMGSLDPIVHWDGMVMLPVLLPTWLALIFAAQPLNQYRLGDELAAARGVNVVVLQAVCVLACTLATATVVAQCGPIGFLGLVVPHIVAMLWGSDCRILLPASALVGGAFLIVCDWGSQLAMRVAGWATHRHLGSATLPIGVMTAVVGVPIFLVLLRSRRT